MATLTQQASAFQDEGWSRRIPDTRTGTRADEVEFRCLKEDSASLTEALRDERVDGTTADENNFSVNEKWHQRSAVSDRMVGDVSLELKRRARALNENWPFRFDGNHLRKNRRLSNVFYEYCLVLARAPRPFQGKYHGLPESFEAFSLQLLQFWLGTGSEGIRTGWPRGSDLPTRARELFTEVNRRVGGHEWRWDPEPNYPADPSPTDLKEAKLDLLAWLKMPDCCGHVYFAGQCYCGITDIEDKARELTKQQLQNWLRPLCWVDFVRCFFTPACLPPALLREIIKLGGATFDRTRIVMIATGLTERKRKSLGSTLQESIKLVLNG